MALRIKEVDGRLVLEGQTNSVTIQFLEEHIRMINNLQQNFNKALSNQ